jgi:DNA-binding CsgD family transcriptional regulator
MDVRERQARLAATRTAVRTAWQAPAFGTAAAQALTKLLPGVEVALHDWTGGTPRSLGDTLPFAMERTSWVREGLIARWATYDPRAVRPMQMQATLGSVLARKNPRKWPVFIEHFLEPYRFRDQLRILGRDTRENTYYVGIFARSDRSDFDEDDASMLEAVRTMIFDHVILRQAFQDGPVDGSFIVAALDAFEEPAFVVSDQGTVIHANAAARSRRSVLPEWLKAFPRCSELAHANVRHVPLELYSHRVHLVVERRAPNRIDHALTSSLDARVPPRLARVARLLVEGSTDKQIAQQTGLAHATVRTYVRELYARLGVHGRVDLVNKLARGQFDESGSG